MLSAGVLPTTTAREVSMHLNMISGDGGTSGGEVEGHPCGGPKKARLEEELGWLPPASRRSTTAASFPPDGVMISTELPPGETSPTYTPRLHGKGGAMPTADLWDSEIYGTAVRSDALAVRYPPRRKEKDIFRPRDDATQYTPKEGLGALLVGGGLCDSFVGVPPSVDVSQVPGKQRRGM